MKSAILFALSVLIISSFSFAATTSCGWHKVTDLDGGYPTGSTRLSDGMLLVSTSNGEIWKSNKTAESWTKISTLTGYNIAGIAKLDKNLYVAATGPTKCAVFRSADNGVSWSQIHEITAKECSGIVATPNLTLLVSTNSDSNIYYSDKNAVVWKAANTPPMTHVDSLYADSTNVYAGARRSGSSGTITYLAGSGDSGINWQKLYDSSTATIFRMLYKTKMAKVFAAGDSTGTNYLTLSEDNGVIWSTGSAIAVSRINNMYEASTSNIYIATSDGIFKSSNQGSGWEKESNYPASEALNINETSEPVLVAFGKNANGTSGNIYRMGCFSNSPPVADAGEDKDVTANTVVTLDGSKSYDPDSDSLTYKWLQTSGEAVGITGITSSKATFRAGHFDQTYEFEIQVSDSYGTSTARVKIRVLPPCNDGEEKACTTTENCPGVQKCSLGVFGLCIPQTICIPNTTKECYALINGAECPAMAGTQTCDACGAAYSECNAAISECCPNSIADCMLGECAGTKACNSAGTFGECIQADLNCGVATEPDCATHADCASDKACSLDEGKCITVVCAENEELREHICVVITPADTNDVEPPVQPPAQQPQGDNLLLVAGILVAFIAVGALAGYYFMMKGNGPSKRKGGLSKI